MLDLIRAAASLNSSVAHLAHLRKEQYENIFPHFTSVPDSDNGGVAEHQPEVDDADQSVEGGFESLRDSVRGQDACSLETITYTNLLTRSVVTSVYCE